MARQVPWFRVAAEGVAIIVSILLAFGIQAWWDDRSIGAQVRQDLQNISEEAHLNRARVVRAIDVRTRLAAGTLLLAQAIESNVGTPMISLPDTLAWLGTAGPNTPDLPFGAVEALIASGRLAFVEDPELRVRLGLIRNKADDAQEGSDRLMRLYDEYYLPLMSEYPYFSEVIAVGMAFWPGGESGRPLRHQVVVDFPNEPALLNYLALRQAQLMSDAGEWREVLSDLDELIERIDAETAHGS